MMVSVLKIPRNHVLKCQKKFLSDLLSAGFLPNYEKKVWKPQISIDWLGFVWDLDKGIHSIPERKMLPYYPNSEVHTFLHWDILS